MVYSHPVQSFSHNQKADADQQRHTASMADLAALCPWVRNLGIFSTREAVGLIVASTVTKSGIMKDERDTPMRKERHRDGKLLRGGVGLTTGLGWSDRCVVLPSSAFVVLELMDR
ncbi:hypothetical protein P691DRAFT_801642 [Macrolepiota fuliginosa MF-IS2]|uniref:Uncharacterized protein n=1 Tax=Macrolepiota fuliginosa MF-IS2 TaxID=1400762 RepID=A0A9P5XAU0_9AGAR|nr:hypothetical protein P691DRAFT_801642 [Macrolepiota fuliginosa MF-IS2]